MFAMAGFTQSFAMLLLYENIRRITINNHTPHLTSPKNQNRRAALGQPAGGGGGGGGLQLVSGRPTLALSSALIPYLGYLVEEVCSMQLLLVKTMFTRSGSTTASLLFRQRSQFLLHCVTSSRKQQATNHKSASYI